MKPHSREQLSRMMFYLGHHPAGRARIGWSYRDSLELRSLLGKIERGEHLDQDEREASRCLGFLTRVALSDYLVYPLSRTAGVERSRSKSILAKGGDECR